MANAREQAFSLVTGGGREHELKTTTYSPEQPWARANAAATSLILDMFSTGVFLFIDIPMIIMRRQLRNKHGGLVGVAEPAHQSDGASVDESS